MDCWKLPSQPQIEATPQVSPAAAQELERARGLMRAGRIAEAEQAYRMVLAREPDCAPAGAALARLLTASGRPAEGEAAVRRFAQALRVWPEALSARAAALKAMDRKAESLADYTLAARLNPKSGVAAHNVASGLGDAGRDREAALEAERAFALGLDAPETWLVYGRALQGLRRLEEAERAFRNAVARRPTYAEALRDLCQLIWMRSGEAGEALAPLEQALAAAPDDASLIGVKVRLLAHMAGEAQALDLGRAALGRTPGDLRLRLDIAQLALKEEPEFGLGLALEALRERPGDPAIRRLLAHAHLALGGAQKAAELAQGLLTENPADQEAAASLATAWRLASDERYRQLWDYERLVRAQTIDTPKGWSSLAAYLEELRGALAELHEFQAHPVEQSVRGGSQTTQNLLHAEHPVIAAFFAAIEGPIRAYRAAVGPGEDVFGSRNTGGHRVLGAWSVRLKPGGFHVDHIHPQGWISSACYIEVPEAVGEGHAGWLRFGAPPIPTRPALEAEHFVRPEPGLLVLFPSYMWHGTVPFGGEAPRMTIAFDLVPD